MNTVSLECFLDKNYRCYIDPDRKGHSEFTSDKFSSLFQKPD